MAEVAFKQVQKSFGAVQVLKQIDLTVADGEFLVLVGPSGCGKSTLLRALAGLEGVTHGRILIDGRVVNDLPPKDRDIAMVFQNYALYPHMSVLENLTFALKSRHVRTRRRPFLAFRTCSADIRATCPAVSVNAWQWGARSCVTRRCSFSTNPCRTLTRSCAFKCVQKSRRCISACVQRRST